MPDGVVQWIDERSGEGVVVRNGRPYPTRIADVEPAARRAGARVHFDVDRDGGVDRAVAVTSRAGARTGHRHARAGALTGARRPEGKGETPFARVHPDARGDLPAHPFQVALAWADAVAQGDRQTALALCSPDLRLHLATHDLTGHRHLDGWLQQHPALGCHRRAELCGAEGDVDVLWEPNGAGIPVPGVRCRVRHGLVVEQWPLEPGPPTTEIPLAAGERRLAVQTRVGPDVAPDAVAYARDRIGKLVDTLAEPVLFARLKLRHHRDPARPLPDRVEVLVDVDGSPVRARVAARTMTEAVDLLVERLHQQLHHRAQRREALHRSAGRPAPGEWRHGALPAPRPDHFDRPVDERHLVRLKSFADTELTVDEAISDMDDLDYDFYLFRDLASGIDSLVERAPTGALLLTRLGGPEETGGPERARAPGGGAARLGPTAYDVALSERTPPRLSVDEAIAYLELTGDQFCFFEDAVSGRGQVCYWRYDGHYGLITPE